MKESYGEALARHVGPESYAGGGNTAGVATTGVHLGPENEFRYVHRPVCRPSRTRGRLHRVDRHGEIAREHGGIYGLVHGWKLQTREPGDPVSLSEEVADSGPKTSPRVQRT
jgi:hypothetical protein